MTENAILKYAWYLDITPNQMFSLYEYPIAGKTGLPLCVEQKEVVVYDRETTVKVPPDHCWVCKGWE